MPRIRSIHPEACCSETLTRVSASAERTFYRLLTHCDDYGRCRYDLRMFKAALYPLHDEMGTEAIAGDIQELANQHLVVLYEVAGKAYLAVRSWSEFQHPKKPTPSKFPPVPQDVVDLVESVGKRFSTGSPLVPNQFPTSSHGVEGSGVVNRGDTKPGRRASSQDPHPGQGGDDVL